MEREVLNRIDVLVVILIYHIADIFIRAFINAFYPSDLEKRLDIIERNFNELTLGCYENEGG